VSDCEHFLLILLMTMVVVQKPTPTASSKTGLLLPSFPPKLTAGLATAHLLNVAIVATVLNAARGFENVTAMMAFYGVYHREPLNQLIHFFGVPLILWSMIVFQAHLPISSATLSLPGVPTHYVTWATATVTFYIGAYLWLDMFGGIIYSMVWYMMYSTAVHWTAKDQQADANLLPKRHSWVGTGSVLRWAMWMHLLGWYVQIHPGHKIIEGAQPAILQSVGGALFTAPLFAFYEGIWFVGLRQDFRQQVLAIVAEYTKDLCATGATMRVCESL
jgi:2-hydroxy fatty acid dioxygenase